MNCNGFMKVPTYFIDDEEKECYVNPDYIVRFYGPKKGGTYISCVNGEYIYSYSTPKEIKKAIEACRKANKNNKENKNNVGTDKFSRIIEDLKNHQQPIINDLTKENSEGFE